MKRFRYIFESVFTLCIMLFVGCNENNPTSPTSTAIIPDGAIWKKETLRRIVPPSDFKAVQIWYQAATLSKNQTGATARLVVDYIKLIEKEANGNERILWEENYNINEVRPLICISGGHCEGGLYVRSPKWFATDEHTPIYNSEIRNGYLTLDAALTPNNILHWWTGHIYNKPNARYYSEIRIKIEGKVGLQIGSDYWRYPYISYNFFDENCIGSNNCEAWISDWYGDTGGEFITIRSPKN